MTTSRTTMMVAGFLTLAAVALAAETIGSRSGNVTTASAQPRGIFTGEYVDGVPVYRLPALTVIADRDGLQTKTERDETLERARQVRAKVVARPPA